MAVCLTRRGENVWPGRNAVEEVITFPLGRGTSRVWQPASTVPVRQNAGLRQALPVTPMRANELGSDLVDCVLMAVMKCLRAWAGVGKHRPRQ
jgi:hypothetical protein